MYKEFRADETKEGGDSKNTKTPATPSPPKPPPPPSRFSPPSNKGGDEPGYVAPSASQVLGEDDDGDVTELPGMSRLNDGGDDDDDEAELPGMAKAREMSAAESGEGGGGAGKKKNQRRRSSMGPGGAERRASWAQTQSILSVKRAEAHAHVVSRRLVRSWRWRCWR